MSPNRKSDENGNLKDSDTFHQEKEMMKSSLPNLKTSLKRGKPFPNIFDWLKVQREDAALGGLWRVHDKLYDLSDFIEKHPGGRDWLIFSQGLDITEAFEASHLNEGEKLGKILAKYYVKDATGKRNSPYTFKEDGFYKTVKRRIAPLLKEIGTGPSAELLRLQDSIVLIYLTLAFLGIWSGSKIIQVAAGLVLGMASIGAHNFLHKADNWRMYYFDLCPLSSYEFRIIHGFSHHLYPNTILDFEVLLAEPLINYLPYRSKNFVQKYLAPLYSNALFTVFTTVQLLGRIRKIIMGKQSLRWENLIIFAELGIAIALSESFWAGLLAFQTIMMSGSFWFVFVGFAHHHPNSFHDGDEGRPGPDFGLCQLDATTGKSDWFHKSLFSVLTTFGEHPLHHLFPTVCHSKLRQLKPIVEEVLEEFSEQIPTLNQFELFVGGQIQMGRTEPNPWTKCGERGIKKRN